MPAMKLLTSIVFLVLLAGNPASAQPATAPRERLPGMQIIERLEQAVAQAQLTEEQRPKVKQAFSEARVKMRELREKAQAGAKPEELREEARQIAAEVREQLAGILTEDQQAVIRGAMRPATQPTEPKPMEPEPMRPRPAAPPPEPEQAPTEPPTPATTLPSMLQPRAGDAAPDFTLRRTDGREVKLSGYNGKTLVLIFGSHSSASFRDRAAGLEQLARRHGSRASFLVVYTREAHAKGEWEIERNRDAGIEVDQPQNLEDRLKQAKLAMGELGLSIPVCADTMNDDAAKAYSSLENSAFIIGKTGKIVARQNWCEPSSLRRHLENALQMPADSE